MLVVVIMIFLSFVHVYFVLIMYVHLLILNWNDDGNYVQHHVREGVQAKYLYQHVIKSQIYTRYVENNGRQQ